MRDSVMWFLVTSVVLTALSMVYVRHQHRIAYSLFQLEESRRDSLNDEWGKLLIEENLWAFHHRIEKDATQRLAMRAPKTADIEYVGLPDEMLEVVSGSR